MKQIKTSFHLYSILFVLMTLVSCAGAPEQPAEREGHPGNINAEVPESPGQQVYEQKCMACHGADGTAGIGNAANLSRSKLDSLSVALLIKEGKNKMPSFKDQLDTAEIAHLVHYVTTLQQ